MFKLLFLAYRDWAIEVYPYVVKHPKVKKAVLCKSTEEMLEELKHDQYDMILFCGWSFEPVKEVVEKIPTFTAHCAELDRYSPGSPLQNQIIDGLKFTKHRMVRVGYPELSLREYSTEVDLDISGNTEEIFLQLKATCIHLYNKFLFEYPNLEWKKWPEQKEQVPRRQPKDSRMTKDMFGKWDTEKLYNFMRGLEDPYPNAFLEDEKGKLYFKKVEFKYNEK